MNQNIHGGQKMITLDKPIVVSGIRATGQLHLGNYYGAIKNFFPLQEKNCCYFFVADYHTLTTAPDPEMLRKHRLPIVKTFLATGIDPQQSSIFYQSALPEVAELTLLLGMIVTVAELNRCTTFKEMVQKHPDNVNHGLFTYPVLMAADIIIHKANIVPVGHDQLQHIEMARSFTRRFNKKYQKIFPIPEAQQHEAIRLPGTDGMKMGKSNDNTIDLLDTPQAVNEKIKMALTDKERSRKNDLGDPENRCASIYPLLLLIANHEITKEVKESCQRGALTCVDCKKQTVELVNRLLEPIQARYHNIKDDDALAVLKEGTQKAKQSASKTLAEVRSAMGLD